MSKLASYRVNILCKNIQIFAMSTGMESRRITAGIIVIGDEILKGHTQDTNSYYLCKHLYSQGVKVQKIVTIGDEVTTIASTVASFSQSYSHVITCGGIGPTHDDKTFEGIARAFSIPLEPHPELVELCQKYFKIEDLKSPKMKMAFIPRSAQLHYGSNEWEQTLYPLVSVNNVYMFPGVPSILEKAFRLLQDLFTDPSSRLHTKSVYVKQDEFSVVSVFNEVDSKFSDRVTLGSYPELHNCYYKVKLTMEAQTEADIQEAYQYLKTLLPTDSIVDYESSPVSHAVDSLQNLGNNDQLRQSFRNNLQNSINIVDEAINRYSLSEICVGFNGGKDCTVILHLFHAAVKRKYPHNKEPIQALYIRSKQDFPEVELFIQKSHQHYNMKILKYNGRIKEKMTDLQQDHPHIKAVIMGSRHSDPHCSHLDSFKMTDIDWPQFMRVNPLLEWSYSDVWTLLRSLSLPYCTLYDRGYTSLGSMENTHPNPLLKYVNDQGLLVYKPAYTLMSGDSERDGRNV